MNHKKIIICLAIFLLGFCLYSAYTEGAEDEAHFTYAQDAFCSAQNAEGAAKASSYSSEIAEYYELALENYKLALKEAQLSVEEEELKRSEEYERAQIIDECREKIEFCKTKYKQVTSGVDVEEIKQQASRYVISGFKNATSGDKGSAKKDWQEAIRLYNRALEYIKEEAALEMIKSKIQEIEHYIEKFL